MPWHHAINSIFCREIPRGCEGAGPKRAPNLRLQGQSLDAKTGLRDNTFRYYDPDVGRFVMKYIQLRNELAAILAEHPDEGRSYRACSDAVIRVAESILELKIPDDYRKFISDFGAADFYGFEIYGITSNDPGQESSVPSCTWFTQSEREHGLPSEFIVIGSSGDGLTYVLSSNQPYAIYAYGDYSFQCAPPQKIANGFCDFFGSYINQAKLFIEQQRSN